MELNPQRLDTLDASAIAAGFYPQDGSGHFHCLFCDTLFEAGRIYSDGDSLVTADRAARRHVEIEHGGAFAALLATGKSQTGISATQAALLSRLFAGETDRRVAEALRISVSTVRNHRFQLRRRAREAKIFLAVMQLLETRKSHEQDFLTLPSTLTVRDERTEISVSQAQEIREKYLEAEPLRIRRFPKKEKLKLVILLEVSKLFEPGRRYDEREVNGKLRAIHDDFGTLRRYLVDYGFLQRTASGSEYWRTES